MEIKFMNGNIADMCADAIVLPANTGLQEGSGSSRALYEKAGRRNLEKACRQHIEQNGMPDVGDVVATSAFHLDAKYLFHAVVPRWIDGRSDEYRNLILTYERALVQADILKCRSIAFPLLASGNNGFDLDLALAIAEEAISRFRPMQNELTTVYLVLYGDRITSMAKEKGYRVSKVRRMENRAVSSSYVNARGFGLLEAIPVAIVQTVDYLSAHPEVVQQMKDTADEIWKLVNGNNHRRH